MKQEFSKANYFYLVISYIISTKIDYEKGALLVLDSKNLVVIPTY